MKPKPVHSAPTAVPPAQSASTSSTTIELSPAPDEVLPSTDGGTSEPDSMPKEAGQASDREVAGPVTKAGTRALTIVIDVRTYQLARTLATLEGSTISAMVGSFLRSEIRARLRAALHHVERDLE